MNHDEFQSMRRREEETEELKKKVEERAGQNSGKLGMSGKVQQLREAVAEVSFTPTITPISSNASTKKPSGSPLRRRQIGMAALLVGWHVFLSLAALRSLQRASSILTLTALGWTMFLYYRLMARHLRSATRPIQQLFDKLWGRIHFRILIFVTVLAAIVAFLSLDTAKSRHRLFGLFGMAFYFLCMVLCSQSPSRIVWRPVLWGFFLQFSMGLAALRWDWGSKQFDSLSELVLTFLEFTHNGTDFVYGFLSSPPKICGMDPVFAFHTAQVIIYFGSVVALLYHFGIMQFAIKRMAWLVQITMNTTATESLNACACIFLGMSEAPLLIRPYLDKMTASELHAVMTTGFSCIAGAVFATYISFGACPRYLLSATVMSAPGSLACSKILYPETEQSQLVSVEELELPAEEESSALECISNGAIMAVQLVFAIVANLIVFLALLALINSVLSWMGELVGQPDWSFELVLGYLFFPLAFVMGVTNPEETFRVAQLMGTKTALNEFIAYKQLGQMVARNELSSRSAMIATILGGMAPARKRLLSQLALRALLAGSISCFMTASLAGILIDQPTKCGPRHINEKCFNVSNFLDRNSSITGEMSWSRTNEL
uniref:Sodium/nucleoside cotransporter n=1 Tax=Globodera rostochiensis TaxID=31243 RepID=A0A914HST4_GLORO